MISVLLILFFNCNLFELLRSLTHCFDDAPHYGH